MTDEEREILASFKSGQPGGISILGTHDSKESKAGKSGIAAHCPVCKYWFELDDYDVLRHILRRRDMMRRLRAMRVSREWLESVWGLKFGPIPKSGVRNLQGRSIGTIWNTGIARGMRHTMMECRRRGQYAFMGIGWNYEDSFGDNFFYCPIGEFFEVMKRLMDDSAEFCRRMLQAHANSLKGATASKIVDAGDGHDDLGAFFDDSTAVRI